MDRWKDGIWIDRKMDRQIERWIDRQIRVIDRQINRVIDEYMNICIYGYMDRQIGQMYKWIFALMDRLSYTQIDKWIHRVIDR